MSNTVVVCHFHSYQHNTWWLFHVLNYRIIILPQCILYNSHSVQVTFRDWFIIFGTFGPVEVRKHIRPKKSLHQWDLRLITVGFALNFNWINCPYFKWNRPHLILYHINNNNNNDIYAKGAIRRSKGLQSEKTSHQCTSIIDHVNIILKSISRLWVKIRIWKSKNKPEWGMSLYINNSNYELNCICSVCKINRNLIMEHELFNI